MSAAGDIANRASKGISEGTPDLQGAVKTGSEIALRMEQAQQNRAKLEQTKVAFKNKLIDQVMEADKGIQAAGTPAARAFRQKVRDARLKQVQPNANPEIIEGLNRDENLQLKQAKVYQVLRLKGTDLSKEEQDSFIAAYGGSLQEFETKLDDILLSEGKTERTKIAAQAQENKFQTQRRDKFITAKGGLVKQAGTSLTKFNDTISKVTDARSNLKLAIKTNNAQAFNQAITSLISINQSRISDADFRLFSGELGIGKLVPFLQKTTGKVPTKTAKNALAVLNNIIDSKQAGLSGIPQNLRLQARTLSQSGFESEAQIAKGLGLERFKLPEKAEKEKEPVKRKTLKDRLKQFDALTKVAKEQILKIKKMTLEEYRKTLGAE